MPRGKQGDQRTKQTERRLEMYKSRPIRDRRGRIIYHEFQSKDKSHEARIQPDRRWFGPARTVPQEELQKFQEEIKTYSTKPNTFILKAGKIPYSLIREPQQVRCRKSARVYSMLYFCHLSFQPYNTPTGNNNYFY